MMHRSKHKRLKRDIDHRNALLFNLASNIINNEAVVTTHEKCKYVKSFVEKLVTRAKKGDSLHNRRMLLKSLRNTKSLVDILFLKISPKYIGRNGGYLSIQKMAYRMGDGAKMAKISWVKEEDKNIKTKSDKLENNTEIIEDKQEKKKVKTKKKIIKKPVAKKVKNQDENKSTKKGTN